MTFFVTKASEVDSYFRIRTFSTIEELIAWINAQGQVIVKRNFWWREWSKDIMRALNVTEDEAKEISQIRNELLIYDDYIE